jgi:hypothetical protein
MSRYRVHSEWQGTSEGYGSFRVEVADALDTKTGTVYTDGAYRVVRNGKPAKKGKGGTVPFYGETAWSDAERLASDLFWQVALED